MPVTTLERIESFVPQASVSIADLAGPLGLTPSKLKMFRRVYGMSPSDMRAAILSGQDRPSD